MIRESITACLPVHAFHETPTKLLVAMIHGGIAHVMSLTLNLKTSSKQTRQIQTL